jgi:quercetin dioxygenase-like cupin family protein
MGGMNYVRLYEDEAGESHFEDCEKEMSLLEFAPPASPVFVTDAEEAKRFIFVRIPADWSGGWHPAPKRQFFFCLSGTIEIKASDGEARTFPPGSVIFAEDTSGKGHDTRVIGAEDALAAIVQLD